MLSLRKSSYEKGPCSERAVTQAIDTIKAKNPLINAFHDIYEEAALEKARICDQETMAGKRQGPLHGIPIGVKDLFLTKGLRTARGSKAFISHVPTEDAPIIQRVEAAGGIIVGKTTTTEMGWSGSSVSELYGPTRNPWNIELTSGGSSSGSGAALASGMVPITLGSDGGGSVRIPASFCGVFAMKGSLGRIPAYPWSATEMLSHAGPMTLTAADSAVMFDLLKGPDPRDHLALPLDTVSYQDTQVDVSTLKIAFAPTLFGVDVNPDVSRVIADCISRIEDAFSISIEKVEPDWEDPIRIFETLWVAGRGIAYGQQVDNPDTCFGKGFSHLVKASRRFSLADYLAAMKDRAVYSSKIHRLFCQYDLLLLPTVPVLPFSAELEAPEGSILRSDILPWTSWTPFTYPFNISGNPAASIPAGLSSSGLPVGLQVVGRRHADKDVLAFCQLIESKAKCQLSLPNLSQASDVTGAAIR